MAQGSITDKDIADLVQRTAEGNSALLRGDINGYLGLVKHAEDYTLMAARGFLGDGPYLVPSPREEVLRWPS